MPMEYMSGDVVRCGFGFANPNHAAAAICAAFPFCWRYDAWGNVLDEEVTVPALASIRYRFQCREWSAATGLIIFRMRWYDAETGRWLSKDPIGLSGGLNLYAFCGNTPISLVDAFGLNWWDATKRFGSDAINGYVRGDFIEDPSLANSIGAIAAGITSIWGQISDALDTIVNAVNVWIIRVMLMPGKGWACVVSAGSQVLGMQPRAVASFIRVRGKRQKALTAGLTNRLMILQRSLGLIETALVISYIQGRPMIIAGVQIIIHGRNF